MGRDIVLKHNELVGLIARQLSQREKTIVSTDVLVGSKWLASVSGGGVPIVDIFTLKKSYTKPYPTIYEVKVSRADFLSDVNSGKYRKYLDFCCKLYFAVPQGLIKRDEVPEDCGLVVWEKKIRNIEKCS